MLSKKIFAGGKLNRDDDYHLLPKNDWVDAKNIRINSTSEGSLGVVVNIKGTIEKYELEFPNGTYQSVGARGFDNVGKIFMFLALVEGAEPDSKIVVWDSSTGTGTILVDRDNSGDTDVLNLSLNHRINHIDLVDERFLYWTDDYNPPRMLDITKNYGVITAKSLSGIKQPPLLPPSNVQAVDDPAGFYNSLGDNAWQFKYRYVYWDNSKSAFSPVSSIGNQRSRGNAAIQTFASKVFDSAIQFNFDGGGALVKGVEIITREGLTSDWKQVASFDFENQSYLPVYRIGMSDFDVSYSLTLTLNGVPTVLTGSEANSEEALNELSLQIDATGFTIDRISKNYVKNSNGYGYIELTILDDTVPITITTSTPSVLHLLMVNNTISNTNTENLFTFTSSSNLLPIEQADAIKPFDCVPLLAGAQALPNGNYLTYGNYTEGYDNVDVDFNVYGLLKSISKPTFEVGMENGDVGTSYRYVRFIFTGTFSNDISLVYQKTLGGGTYSYYNSVPAFDNETEADWLERFGQILRNAEANGTTKTVVVDTGARTVELRTDFFSVAAVFFESIILSRQSATWFKSGNTYKAGIVYIDEYGRFGAVNTVNGNSVTIPMVQNSVPSVSNSIPVLSILSLAPSWASKYAIVLTKGSGIARFIQSPIDDGYTFNVDGTITLLDRSVKDYNTDFDASLDLEFTKGDEVVLFNDDGQTFTTTLLRRNEDGDDTNYVIYANGITAQTFSNFNLKKFEIRKRVTVEDSLFYQVAVIGDVSPEGYHLKPTGNGGSSQTVYLPAQIWIENGDISVRNGWMDSAPTAFRTSEWLEYYSFSDYDSTLNNPNLGTANVVNTFEKQTRYPGMARFSGAYVVGTSVNNINSFDADSFKDFGLNYGAIQKLDVDGNTLIVGQQLRIGAAPIFESVLLDKNGTETVAISERLLNDIKYYDYQAGIGDAPEAYVRWGSTKYFVDKKRGLVCRLAANGITPISITAKMNSYFTKKLKSVVSADGLVIGGFDPTNKEYYITLTNGESNETIIFCENSDGFTTFIDMVPSSYVTLLQDVYSFSGNKMWVHNASEAYNNFYGVQHDSEFTFVDNESAMQVKSYLSLSESASDLWTVPSIETSLNQSSNLVASDFLEAGGIFNEFEGGFFAGFLNDSNSPGGIIEGDTLKGKWIKIKLLNSNTNFVYLLGVGVNQVPSLQGNI